MIIPLVIATAAVTMIIFLAGYRLAIYHNRIYTQSLFEEGDSLEPIFAALDREYLYTDNLNKPFTNDK